MRQASVGLHHVLFQFLTSPANCLGEDEILENDHLTAENIVQPSGISAFCLVGDVGAAVWWCEGRAWNCGNGARWCHIDIKYLHGPLADRYKGNKSVGFSTDLDIRPIPTRSTTYCAG